MAEPMAVVTMVLIKLPHGESWQDSDRTGCIHREGRGVSQSRMSNGEKAFIDVFRENYADTVNVPESQMLYAES
jgi:hypothetical protein